MKKPLVSIIVPVYKAEKTLLRCVNSLINQTYKNIEILLIENNSPDNSGKLCDSFSNNNIHVYHLRTSGVSRARNVGLKHARGEYIAFCDSDDYYSKDHIECLIDSALLNKADVVISGYYREDKGRFIDYNLKISKSMDRDEILKNVFLTDFVMGSCWNKIYKRSLIGNTNFRENLSVMEDTYFFLEVLQKAKNVYYEGKTLYFYCENNNSTVRNIETTLSNDKTNSLYIVVYNMILKDFSLSSEVRTMIKCKKFESAVWCNYLLKTGKIESKELEKNIKEEIKIDQSIFLGYSKLSLKYKMKIMIFLYLPILKTIKDSTLKK